MRLVSDLKGAGYLTSTASVALLGAVSWKSASENGWLLAGLVLGMALSVAGMMLRWRSHRLEQKEKDADKAAGRAGGRPSAASSASSAATPGPRGQRSRVEPGTT
jgi:hypothetical protein